MIHNIPTASLSEQLYQIETLETAWRKVRANKGGPGSDGITIQQFETQLNKHLNQLSRELAEERYYPLAENLDSLLGYEGVGASAYYRAFEQFLAEDWGFTTRQYRPSPDQ